MSRTLITTKGSFVEPSKRGLAAHLKQAEEEGFWLDIEAPDEDDFDVLENIFKFHALTIEDVRHRNQRPKLEEYSGYSFMVAFSAELANGRLVLVEHDIYLGRHYVITIHDEPAVVLSELRDRIRKSPELTKNQPAFLTYLVIDAIVECNFPPLARLDEMIDELQDDIIEKANPAMLSTIYGLKHDITELRRNLSAQRDLFQQLVSHSLDLHQHDLMVYWRDVHDHILRQYETVDSLRDLLTGAMDVYLSTVSNRLNATMKTLTVVASLFLPLTWLTGFYGMNFAYLTGVLQPATWAFWVGVATMVGALVIQVIMFRRRGWL
jgi:magnesium transporter